MITQTIRLFDNTSKMMYINSMENWKVLLYETENQQCPVQDFIDAQSNLNQAKILSIIEQLQNQGPILPRPYADLLTDGIHELRIKLSGNQTRILYFFCYQKFIILTHSFIKTTDKVPVSEIKKAKEVREEFLSRYNEKTLLEIYDEKF